MLIVARNGDDGKHGIHAFLEDKARSAGVINARALGAAATRSPSRCRGSFLTRGGSGAAMESLSAGVPIGACDDERMLSLRLFTV